MRDRVTEKKSERSNLQTLRSGEEEGKCAPATEITACKDGGESDFPPAAHGRPCWRRCQPCMP